MPNRLTLATIPLLLAAALATPALASEPTTDLAPAPQPEPEIQQHSEAHARTGRRRTVAGDLTSRWFHVGGGAGMVADPVGDVASHAGRFVLGGGGYTFMLYGGGGMEITGSAVTTPSFSGVGYFGVAIPVPVVHPLIGVRGHVGMHPLRAGASSPLGLMGGHAGLGMQAGFIIREFDGRPGVRLMLDAGAEVRPDESRVYPDVFLTLAAVF